MLTTLCKVIVANRRIFIPAVKSHICVQVLLSGGLVQFLDENLKGSPGGT